MKPLAVFLNVVMWAILMAMINESYSYEERSGYQFMWSLFFLFNTICLLLSPFILGPYLSLLIERKKLEEKEKIHYLTVNATKGKTTGEVKNPTPQVMKCP